MSTLCICFWLAMISLNMPSSNTEVLISIRKALDKIADKEQKE